MGNEAGNKIPMSDEPTDQSSSLLPLSDKQAELAKTTLEEAERLGSYVARILGDFPRDFVDVVAGQHFRFARAVIADTYDRKIQEILRRREVKIAPVSPSIGVPLLEAAYEELDPNLQQLWAELIAAAMDPSRSSRVRRRFIETVRQGTVGNFVLWRGKPRE